MINCKDNHVNLKKYLEAMLRVAGPLTGMPIVFVTGHTSPAINCTNNHLNFDDFVRLSIGVDSCSKPALRVKVINSCNVLRNCINKSDNNALKKMFAYDNITKTYALVLNITS